VRVLGSQLGVFWRYPRGYLRTLLHVLWGREFRSLGRGLRRFCQTCCLVHELGPVRHLHAHFANDPTRLASWARMICGVSFSVTTHAKDLYQDARIDSPGLKFKLRQARFVVANSEFSAAGLRTAFDGEIPPKILTIYNAVDLAAFPPRQNEATEPFILSVGRLVEKKGFADLIQACRLLRDRQVPFKCEIIGSGPLRDELQGLISQLGLLQQVRLRGQMAQAELGEHYRKAMVFALPCIVAANGDRDILPNVLKEAMAIGVPVVTSRLAGIEELVTHDETGLLVTPGDTKSLAEALRQLLADAMLRRRLAVQARKVIEERFELGANFARLRSLLQEANLQSDETPQLLGVMTTQSNAHRGYHG
jgi:glycosyltransferase involved in cell wall biosynthesis